jgi:hypothetical protein
LAQPDPKVRVAGKATYIIARENYVEIAWAENVKYGMHSSLLYIIRAQSVPKEEVVKLAESLYLVE